LESEAGELMAIFTVMINRTKAKAEAMEQVEIAKTEISVFCFPNFCFLGQFLFFR